MKTETFNKNKGLNKSAFLFGTLALVASACNNPETFFTTRTDRFTNHISDNYSQASQLLQADYLFVVDFSYSMSRNGSGDSKTAQLLNSMSLFTENLRNQEIDYRIGFTNGNSHAGNAAEISNDFVAPFLTLETLSSLESEILAQIGTVGEPLNRNTNYLLEASKRTLSARATSFLREAAQLVVVFVSDSDDVSHQNNQITGDKTVAGYTQSLRGFKSHPSYINARSLTAGVAANCTLQNSYDVAGTRIASVAQQLDALEAAPSCIYRPFSESLADLARNVTRPTNRFRIRGNPEPSSIYILENGATVATSRYSYNSVTNEIIFAQGQEPALSANLEIVYDMLFPLSQRPRTNSISVTLNGISVPQSQTQGWTYNASENRIEFHGSARPSEGDDIRINYEPGSNS